MKLYSAKIVAKYLDISEKRVKQLSDENIIKEFKPGLYDLQAAINSYVNYLRKDNPSGDEDINYNVERAKLVKVKRENEELDLMIRKKDLHKTEEIEQVMVVMLLRFKSRLMSMPSKLSPVLAKKTDKAEIFKVMKSNIDDALNELSNFETLFAEELDDGKENN